MSTTQTAAKAPSNKTGTVLSTASNAFSTARNLHDSAMSGDFVGFGHSIMDGIFTTVAAQHSRGETALKQVAQKHGQSQAPAQAQAPTQATTQAPETWDGRHEPNPSS